MKSLRILFLTLSLVFISVVSIAQNKPTVSKLSYEEVSSYLKPASSKSNIYKDKLFLSYGDLKAFKQTGKANLVISYPNLKIEDKDAAAYIAERGKDFASEFEEGKTTSQNAFMEKWNNKVKGISLVNEEAPYELHLFINNLDMGSVGGAMWGMGANAGGASISGCLALIDKSSNTPVSVVLIKGIQGKGTNGFIIYGEFKRMNLAFEKLAEGMAKTR